MLSIPVHGFLDLLAYSEGTSTDPRTQNNGYDIIVNGHDGLTPLVTDYSCHPFLNPDSPRSAIFVGVFKEQEVYSTASGRYQIIKATWAFYAKRVGVKDFSPASQDAVCAAILEASGVTEQLEAGNLISAIQMAGKQWASLPTSQAGQPGQKTFAQLQAFMNRDTITGQGDTASGD